MIVVDDRDVAVGTLSDGDARKAILDRRLLSTPVRSVMNMNFISVGPDEEERAKQSVLRLRIRERTRVVVDADERHVVEIEAIVVRQRHE